MRKALVTLLVTALAGLAVAVGGASADRFPPPPIKPPGGSGCGINYDCR